MRSCILLLLALLLALAGCKPEDAPAELQLVRALVVDPKPIGEDRHAIGEVKPRYESDLSFRVAGKVLSRLVDVGASVKQGDTLATLDTQDYQNRLRSAEADVSSAEAALVKAQGTEARQAKLLKDGWTPKATYDTALQNSAGRRSAAQSCQGQSRPDPRPAQLHHPQGRFRRRDYCRRRGSRPECECRPNGGEAGATGRQGRRLQHRGDSLHRCQRRASRSHRLAAVQPRSDGRRRGAGDFSGRRSGDAHLHGQSHAEEPAAATSLRHEYRRPLERAVPLSRSRCHSPPFLKRTVRRPSGCSISNRAVSL